MGVSRENRKDLIGHATNNITTHYVAVETGVLLAYVERLVGMDKNRAGYLVNAH